MDRGATRVLAWSIAGAEIALFTATVLLGFLVRHDYYGGSWGSGFGNTVVLLVPMLAFPLFGGLIAERRPSNPIGWICLASGAFWFLTFFMNVYAIYGLRTHPGSLPAPAVIGPLGSWVPAVGLLGTFLFLLFPDGHLLSRRWRAVAWVSAVTIAILSVGSVMAPGRVADLPGTSNPLAPGGTAGKIINGLNVLFPVFLACIIASVVSVVLRYRRAGTDEREKLKWVAFAGVGFVLLYAIAVAASQTFAPGTKTPLFVSVLQDLAAAGYAFLPTAAFFAVLRYRLYDIDKIISRTLSYAIVSTVLIASYVLIALVPTAVLGSKHVPSGLVAGAVLVVAVLFRPLRRRVQNAVDQRFNRARYDALRTVESFAARLRDEIDINTLKIDLETLVQHTMEPTHVSLWLRGELSSS